MVVDTEAVKFNSVNSATAVYRLGKLNRSERLRPNSQAVQKLISIAESDPNQLDSYSLANMCYGIAVGKLCPTLPGFLLGRMCAADSFRSFSPQDLSVSLWSLATLQSAGSDQALSSAARALLTPNHDLKRFTFQSIANILWSFASLRHTNGEVFALLGDELASRDWALIKPQDVANIAWAFASLGVHHAALFEKVNAVLTSQHPELLSGFKPQELTNLAWSLATLGLCEFHDLYANVERAVRARGLAKYSTRELAQLSWSLATVRRVSQLPEDVCRHVLLAPRLSGANARDYVDVLWSLCQFPCPGSEVVAQFSNRFASEVFPQVSPKHVCLVLWCFACLDVLGEPGVRQLFASKLVVAITELSSVDLTQLDMVALAWEQRHQGVESPLLDELYARCRVRELTTATTSSQNHKSITNWLRMHVTPDLIDEYVLESNDGRGGLIVDGYVPSLKQVIEIDGPTHYDAETGERLVGSTVFKHRLIANSGYALLPLPLQKFQSSARKQRLEMLHQVLERALPS